MLDYICKASPSYKEGSLRAKNEKNVSGLCTSIIPRYIFDFALVATCDTMRMS